MIAKRVAKAGYELTFAPRFDVIIVNDDLEEAQQKALSTIKTFLQI
jgi:guanylate kinase